MPKAGYHLGLASLLLLAGAGSVHDATALNETRTLSFHHTHSEEDLAQLIARSAAIGFVSKARLSGAAIRDTLERAA